MGTYVNDFITFNVGEHQEVNTSDIANRALNSAVVVCSAESNA